MDIQKNLKIVKDPEILKESAAKLQQSIERIDLCVRDIFLRLGMNLQIHFILEVQFIFVF
jgi:hypothetical protein